RSGATRALHQRDLVSAAIVAAGIDLGCLIIKGTERMLTETGSAVHQLLRGWSGLVLDYAAVQAPMWVAMVRRHAGLQAFVASPAIAGTLMVATGLGISLAGPLLHALHVADGGLMEFAIGGGVGGLLGYGGGRALATPHASRQGYVRGATVVAAEEVAGRRAGRQTAGRKLGASMD